jgi:putative transposase
VNHKKLRRRQEPALRWSLDLDFHSDMLTDSPRFRILSVVDDVTRKCLALVADTSLSGARVARELDLIIGRRGAGRSRLSDSPCATDGSCRG